ncbi:MAG: hypothetical protein IJ660_00990 [Alphaproteobacteria bacterium]|jgi:hypothetical protein|nr:hypothetical protein [Alphaproteobacteria bacterium]
MPKLLVTSTVNITDECLRLFAESCQNVFPNVTAEQFLKDIYSGNKATLEYPDHTASTYEIVKEN